MRKRGIYTCTLHGHQIGFIYYEKQKEIRKQNNDGYLSFENAEMKRETIFPTFFADKVLKHSGFNTRPSATNTVHKEQVKTCENANLIHFPFTSAI